MFHYVKLARLGVLMLFTSGSLMLGAAGGGGGTTPLPREGMLGLPAVSMSGAGRGWTGEGASDEKATRERGTLVPLEIPDVGGYLEFAVSPDHSLIVAYSKYYLAGESGSVAIFNATTGKLLSNQMIAGRKIEKVSFSPRGDLLVLLVYEGYKRYRVDILAIETHGACSVTRLTPVHTSTYEKELKAAFVVAPDGLGSREEELWLVTEELDIAIQSMHSKTTIESQSFKEDFSGSSLFTDAVVIPDRNLLIMATDSKALIIDMTGRRVIGQLGIKSTFESRLTCAFWQYHHPWLVCEGGLKNQQIGYNLSSDETAVCEEVPTVAACNAHYQISCVTTGKEAAKRSALVYTPFSTLGGLPLAPSKEPIELSPLSHENDKAYLSPNEMVLYRVNSRREMQRGFRGPMGPGSAYETFVPGSVRISLIIGGEELVVEPDLVGVVKFSAFLSSDGGRTIDRILLHKERKRVIYHLPRWAVLKQLTAGRSSIIDHVPAFRGWRSPK